MARLNSPQAAVHYVTTGTAQEPAAVSSGITDCDSLTFKRDDIWNTWERGGFGSLHMV